MFHLCPTTCMGLKKWKLQCRRKKFASSTSHAVLKPYLHRLRSRQPLRLLHGWNHYPMSNHLRTHHLGESIHRNSRNFSLPGLPRHSRTGFTKILSDTSFNAFPPAFRSPKDDIFRHLLPGLVKDAELKSIFQTRDLPTTICPLTRPKGKRHVSSRGYFDDQCIGTTFNKVRPTTI